MDDQIEVTATERARVEALRLAVGRWNVDDDTGSIVKRAEAFFAFLSGAPAAPEA